MLRMRRVTGQGHDDGDHHHGDHDADDTWGDWPDNQMTMMISKAMMTMAMMMLAKTKHD